jgi:hypothetical protein
MMALEIKERISIRAGMASPCARPVHANSMQPARFLPDYDPGSSAD